VIKLRRARRAGHIKCIREIRNANRIVVENLKGKDHLKDQDVDGSPILKWI
jgi:hypothetical protein